MDVPCLNCHEPWDIDELRHELAHELPEVKSIDLSDMPEKVKRDYVESLWHAGDFSKMVLADHFREVLKEQGWKFGPTTVVVLRCPACKKGSKRAISHLYETIDDMFSDNADTYLAWLTDDSESYFIDPPEEEEDE